MRTQLTVRRKHLQMIYRLEREYGVSAYLFKTVTITPNYLTGKTTKTVESIHIPKFITWEVDVTNKFEYDIGYLAANKNFTYGGIYQPGDRLGLFRVLEPLKLDVTMYFMYEDETYLLKDYKSLDVNGAYIVQIRKTSDQKLFRILERKLLQHCKFSQTVTGTL